MTVNDSLTIAEISSLFGFPPEAIIEAIRRNRTSLKAVNAPLIERFKIHREKQINAMKQSCGGSSIALDITILHRVFAYGISKGLMQVDPINLKHESKPGKNPKNGARPSNAAELVALRKAAGKDLFAFVVLRWTGLRVPDAINLKWANVHFARGANGAFEVMTQKRGKPAIVPLSPELNDTLQSAFHKRKPEDQVLINPETAKPFSSRARLDNRMKELGVRAGVPRVHPHCFRDSLFVTCSQVSAAVRKWTFRDEFAARRCG